MIITAHGTVDTAVEALKIGAFDFVTKPFDKDEVRQIVAKALKTRELARRRRDAGVRRRRARASASSAAPPGIADLYAILERVADTPTTVLITGESGTGKELVARALHEHSSRKDKPFIKVNCAAIPKELIESELFGYERGAFTGAVASKPGRFELANGGTLFLDEIGEIPVEMQVKLLRALQESEFERVGGIKTIRVDVRLVAATNRDLKKLIAGGPLPRGPLLPPERRAHPPAAAARAHGRHPAARRALSREVQRAPEEEGRGRRARRDRASSRSTRGPATSASSRT